MLTRFSIALALALLSVPASAATRVVDGDTIVIGRENIRLLNIDAPELRHAHCDAEKRLALVAKRRLGELMEEGPARIVRGDGKRMKDRYGRTLAHVIVGGRDVGEVLVEEGLARPWTGKRQPWCD